MVSIGVMVMKDGAILLGKRKGATGSGEWGLPGGHLEHGETFEEGVLRELDEEVGISVQNIRPLCVANVQRYLPKHYVYHGFVADWLDGEPILKEPNKCEGWAWYKIDHLPEGNGLIPDLCLKAFKSGGFQYYPLVK